MAGLNLFGAISGGKLLGIVDPALRASEAFANSQWPNMLPDPLLTMDAWFSGALTGDAAMQALRAAGIPVGVGADEERNWAWPTLPQNRTGWQTAWQAVAAMRQGVLDLGTALQLLNMLYISEEDFTQIAKRNGLKRAPDRNALVWLSRNSIPSPSELVTFATREAWDDAVAARFGYDEEFPPEFKYWMQRQGADGNAETVAIGGPGHEELTWSKLRWRVKWRNLSPTSAYEMFQRLRPGRVERYRRDLPDVRAFTLGDLETVLRVNDFPKPFRPQLAAIAYRRPRLVDIDRFYQNGTIDAAEVEELHLDLGYSPNDATQRTAWLVRKTFSGPAGNVGRNLAKQIVELYSLGQLGRDQALARIIEALTLGRYPANLWQTLQHSTRTDFVIARQTAEQMLSQSELKAQIERTRKLVAGYRKHFLRGAITETTLRNELFSAGFEQDWLNRFVAGLKLELATGRLQLSTERIQNLASKHILPMNNARQMLNNLGWTEPNVSYLIRDIQRNQDLQDEREAEKQAREQERRDESLLRQARLLERQRDKVVKKLNDQASPTQLQRYYILNIITRDKYIQELTRRGYETLWIKAQVEEADFKRDTARYKRENEPIDGGSNGNGRPPGPRIGE